MTKMTIKRLGRHEEIAIKALKSGHSRAESYLKAYPIASRLSGQELNLKAMQFFNMERIKEFMNSDDVGTPSAIHGEIMPRIQIKPNQIGRPSKYHPDIVQKMIDYFDIAPYGVEITENEKTGEITERPFVSDLPTKAGFAAKSGVCKDSLCYWATVTDKDGFLKYPDFSEAYKAIEGYQEHVLVTNTLNGNYKESFAKFLAKNYLGMRDNAELTVVGDADKPIVVINKDMTPEQAALAYKELMNRD